MPPVYFGNSKVNFSGIEKAYLGSNLVWKKSDVIYTPILPDDTATYPMYLKGWKIKTYNGSEDWSQQSTQKWFSRYEDTLLYQSSKFRGYCDMFPTSTVAAASMPNNSFVPHGYNNRGRVVFQHTSTENTTAWKTWLTENPISVLVPLATSDNSLWFAVNDGNSYGYYCPESGEFISVYGMTGTVIQRVEYVEGDNDAYCKTSYHLRGDDTLKIKFQVGSNASNIGGCFVSSSAQDNFCLYAGAGAKWYMRYDGGNNRNYTPTSEWQELEASPTGAKVNGSQVETWTQASFTSSSPMYIGYLYQSTSPKIRGKIAHFEVVGKHTHLPVKIGSEYRIMDVLAWELDEQVGTWSGGPVISEQIPFPTEITQGPVLLTMGGSPNPNPEGGDS